MWQALFGRGGQNSDDTSSDEAVARALQASLDDETRRRRRRDSSYAAELSRKLNGGADAFIDLTGHENDRRRSVVDLRSPEKKKRRPALADITRSAPRPARPAAPPQRRAVSDPRHGRGPARSPPAPRSLARLMRGDGAATPPRSPPPPPRPQPTTTPVARTLDVRRFVDEGFVVIRGAVDPRVEISQ